MNRREMMGVLALAPLAASLGVQKASAETESGSITRQKVLDYLIAESNRAANKMLEEMDAGIRPSPADAALRRLTTLRKSIREMEWPQENFTKVVYAKRGEWTHNIWLFPWATRHWVMQ